MLQIAEIFPGWQESGLQVRLDIWHFMRRFAACCTTESHPLYGEFLARLSGCIFEYDPNDLQQLTLARLQEMKAAGLPGCTYEEARRKLTKRERARHCRRRTRGAERTKAMIGQLLEAFQRPSTRDLSGVDLLKSDLVEEVWKVQMPHVCCLQDPPNIQLYTITGMQVIGGISLPVYRCARGSNSLESFHDHVRRFVPGTTASDVFFQAYLLDGLSRWNADRARSAHSSDSGGSVSSSYSESLKRTANLLHKRLKDADCSLVYCRSSRKYTGELIGVEYLYKQTGTCFEEQMAQLDEIDCVDWSVDGDDEGFNEPDDPTLPDTDFDMLDDSTPGEPVAASSVQTKEDTTGPGDSVGQYEKVEQLADYLVELCAEQSQAISTCHAEHIVCLWNNLSDYDRKPTQFAPRHRTKLSRGTFKSQKGNPSTTSGVAGLDSLRRGFLSGGEPAQWPDCNRYSDCIMRRLCERYPSSKTENGKRVDRWMLVSRAYLRIRTAVISCQLVMNNTKMQLVPVNQTTLKQWWNRIEKEQEVATVVQGVRLFAPSMAAEEQLPAARLQPAPLPVFQTEELLPMPLVLPESSQAQTTVVEEEVQAPSSMPPTPRSTLSYRLKRQMQTIGGIPVRRNKPRTMPTICGQCKEVRDKDSHTQYFGSWYCQK
uniref:uncharacterized protein LOC113475553 n=1 Tax=Ciona intestinalis TaxID=7719 RepID=UPI000EF55379|nr:uncharacterized protein LOC113475553 [Ciona intestinalis]|eukprot:XP_026695572.1 uncharacterized protein LOC113475553 [Ciona intestinalis]